jgi:hypothetical protein
LRDYGGGELVQVPLLELASYRRTDGGVFTFCRTQAGPGDVGPREFYQPEEEEEVMSEVTPEPQPVEETEEEETVEETETTEEPATAPATEPEGELEF